MSRYFEKIPGERLYLSPLNPDDAELYTKWLNDPEVAVWLYLHAKVISLHSERKWLENAATGDDYNFSIVARTGDGDRLIGNISLMSIQPVHRSAVLGIIIGEAEFRSKGYGAEAIQLLLEYGFQTLNLHSILLDVNAENARAIACYKKCGFKECARRREMLFMDGRFVDSLSMDILDREFMEVGNE